MASSVPVQRQSTPAGGRAVLSSRTQVCPSRLFGLFYAASELVAKPSHSPQPLFGRHPGPEAELRIQAKQRRLYRLRQARQAFVARMLNFLQRQRRINDLHGASQAASSTRQPRLRPSVDALAATLRVLDGTPDASQPPFKAFCRDGQAR